MMFGGKLWWWMRMSARCGFGKLQSGRTTRPNSFMLSPCTPQWIRRPMDHLCIAQQTLAKELYENLNGFTITLPFILTVIYLLLCILSRYKDAKCGHLSSLNTGPNTL